MKRGTEIEGVAQIGGKQVPLPVVTWEVVISGGDAKGVVRWGGVYLVQRAGENIAGSLFFLTNLESGPGSGWKRPGWCRRDDFHHNGSDEHYNRKAAACWIVKHRVVSNRFSKETIPYSINNWLRKRGATATMVGNRYRRHGATDYLLVAHFVHLAAHGFKPEHDRGYRRSRWHPNKIKDGSRRQRFIGEIKAFGEQYREAVRAGFRNRL